MNYENCKRCNAFHSIIDDYVNGVTVCTFCGLVYQENIIIDEDEVPNYKNENKRIDIPENPYSMNNLGTTLQVETNGVKKNIKISQNIDNKSKNIIFINKFLANAEVKTNVINKVIGHYDILANNKNLKGIEFKNVVIALYYQACKEVNENKQFNELANTFNISEDELKNTFNKIKDHIFEKPKYEEKEQNEEINEAQTETNTVEQKEVATEVPIEQDLISREKNYIINFFGVDESKYEIKKLAFEIVENFNNNSILEGKAPKTICGLTLLLSYILLNDNIDDSEEIYKEFSKKTTLSKYFEEIKNSLTFILPKEYHDKIDIIKNFRI